MAKSKQLKQLEDGLREELQKIANSKKATIISFVAPQAVRTSPVTFSGASIEEAEIYRLEEIFKRAEQKKATKNLHLIVHTPGGEMHASYKVASFIRSKFTNIKGFVPYEAASGGTVLCCAANELYIGELGNLTAFDPQVNYKDYGVSTYAFIRAVHRFQQDYGEMSPGEIPPPWQQMADKLDPIIYDEMNTVLFTSIACAKRLLEKSGYPKTKAEEIATKLAWNFYTHAFPLFAKDAEEIGFNVKNDNAIMQTYRKLVSFRLKEEFPRHVIDDFYPGRIA